MIFVPSAECHFLFPLLISSISLWFLHTSKTTFDFVFLKIKYELIYRVAGRAPDGIQKIEKLNFLSIFK